MLDNTITTALHTIQDHVKSGRQDYEATPPTVRSYHIYHSVITVADWFEVYGN